jgi:hypothetical protein
MAHDSLKGRMSSHIGNAIWLVSALPFWYLSAVTRPPQLGVLYLVPCSGIVALVAGVVSSVVRGKRLLLLFLGPLLVSELYVAVAGFFRGQLRGSASAVPFGVFAVLQASLIGFLVYRLKGARLAASLLAVFCVSYALFTAFVAAMACADDWL